VAAVGDAGEQPIATAANAINDRRRADGMVIPVFDRQVGAPWTALRLQPRRVYPTHTPRKLDRAASSTCVVRTLFPPRASWLIEAD